MINFIQSPKDLDESYIIENNLLEEQIPFDLTEITF